MPAKPCLELARSCSMCRLKVREPKQTAHGSKQGKKAYEANQP